MVRYFLSYARSDGSKIVKELANRLRAIGHEAFLDTQGIEGGVEWEKELIRRTKWCDVALIIVTPGSNSSKYVYNEFREAEKNHKLIIPIVVDKTPLPPHLTQYHAFSIENESFDTLLLRLETSTRGVGEKGISRSRLLILTAIIIVIVGVVALIWNNSNSLQNTAVEQTKTVAVAMDVTSTLALTGTAESTASQSFTNTPKDIQTSTHVWTLTPNTILNTDIPTTTKQPIIIPTTAVPTTASQPTIIPNTAVPTTTKQPTVIPTTAVPTVTSTLTSIPANKLLYHEDFEGSVIKGWSGEFGIIKDSDTNHIAVLPSLAKVYLDDSKSWTNYAVTLRYFVTTYGPEGGWSVDFRADKYLCSFYNLWLGDSWMILTTLTASTTACDDDHTRTLYGKSDSISLRRWHDLYISVNEYSIEWKSDTDPLHSVKDGSHMTGGLQFLSGVDSEIWIDDITVVSLE